MVLKCWAGHPYTNEIKETPTPLSPITNILIKNRKRKVLEVLEHLIRWDFCISVLTTPLVFTIKPMKSWGKQKKGSSRKLLESWLEQIHFSSSEPTPQVSHGQHRVSVMWQSQGTKISKHFTCPAGWVTYNFHLSCKHMHLSFKSICNKEYKGVICNMTSSSYSFQSTRPVGRVLWEKLLILFRFHS